MPTLRGHTFDSSYDGNCVVTHAFKRQNIHSGSFVFNAGVIPHLQILVTQSAVIPYLPL